MARCQAASRCSDTLQCEDAKGRTLPSKRLRQRRALQIPWWSVDRAEDAGRPCSIAGRGSRGLSALASGTERGRLMERCKDCGANLALVGSRHNCRPRGILESHYTSPAAPAARVPSRSLVPSRVPSLKPGTQSDRNRRWRAKNLDRHRQYHAAYMRTWRTRTAQKSARSPSVNTAQEQRSRHATA